MPRPKNPENQKYPQGWRFYHGAFYYRVPKAVRHLWDNKTQYRLGKTEQEAYHEWCKRLSMSQNIYTIGQLLDRYNHEVVPNLAISTHQTVRNFIKNLRAVFGQTNITLITPKLARRYYDKKNSKSSAKHELSILRAALSKAVEWGFLDTNPLRIKNDKPRKRDVKDWEIKECLSVKPKNGDSVLMLQVYIQIKQKIGLRKIDMLKIQLTELTDQGIYVETNKSRGQKAILFEWNDDLVKLVKLAIELRPNKHSPFLFCNKKGDSYLGSNNRCSGFDSMWQRFMKRALEETKLDEKFQERDLRAKAGSDMAMKLNDQEASKLLTHSNVQLTRQHYIRGDAKVTKINFNKGSKK